MQYYKCSSAVLEMNLKPTTLQVYHFLAAHVDFRTHSCFHSKKTIASRLGISVSSVRRATIELVKKGLLKIQERFARYGQQTSNLYTLIEQPQTSLESPVKPQKNNKGLFAVNCHTKAVQGKIKGAALKIYTFLESMATSKRTCSLSVKEIACTCQVSITCVRHAIKLLAKKKLLNIVAKKAISKWGKQQNGKNEFLLPSFHFSTANDTGVLHSVTPLLSNLSYINTNRENFDKVCLNIDTGRERNITSLFQNQEQIHKMIDIFVD